jgi:hypothetical protein
MNGTSAHYSADKPLDEPTAPEPDKVYRSHDTERAAASAKAQTVDANAKLADRLGDHLDHMDKTAADLAKTVADLAKVMSRRDAPAAAVSSPIPQSATQRENFDKWFGQATALKRLKVTTLENGDRSVSLPIDGLSDIIAATVSDREAFIDRAPSLVGGASHLEMMRSDERSISYVMTYALAKWGNDPIIIHAGDKHVERIVEHAVAQGLTVANTEPHIQALVASARERQNNPLAREAHERDATIIERVQSNGFGGDYLPKAVRDSMDANNRAAADSLNRRTEQMKQERTSGASAGRER